MTASVYGATKDGEPMRLGGWAKAIRSTMTVPFLPGTREATIDDARCAVSVEVVGPAGAARRRRAPTRRTRPTAAPRSAATGRPSSPRPVLAPTAAELASARERWAEVREPRRDPRPHAVRGHDQRPPPLRGLPGALPPRAGRRRGRPTSSTAPWGPSAPPISPEADDPAASDAPDEGDARLRDELVAERWDEGREVLARRRSRGARARGAPGHRAVRPRRARPRRASCARPSPTSTRTARRPPWTAPRSPWCAGSSTRPWAIASSRRSPRAATSVARSPSTPASASPRRRPSPGSTPSS